MEANGIILAGETFTTYSAAQTRSCNNQHNACADIANNNTVFILFSLLSFSKYLTNLTGWR